MSKDASTDNREMLDKSMSVFMAAVLVAASVGAAIVSADYFMSASAADDPQNPITIQGWVNMSDGTPVEDGTHITVYNVDGGNWHNTTADSSLSGCNYMVALKATSTDSVRVNCTNGSQSAVSSDILMDTNPTWVNLTLSDTPSASVGNQSSDEGTDHEFTQSSDGTIDNYNWDLDNDGVYNDATGSDPLITWNELTNLGIGDDGTFTVGLNVSNDENVWDTDTCTFTVNNVAPSAPTSISFNPSSGNLYIDDSLQGTGSGSNDIDNDTVTYEYRFRSQTDGYRLLQDWSSTDSYSLTSGLGDTGESHDTIIVDVRATDEDGGTSTVYNTSNTIGVENTAPTGANVAGDTIDEGSDAAAFSEDGSASDADGDTLTYNWSMNEGSPTYNEISDTQSPSPTWSELTGWGIDDGGNPSTDYSIAVQVDDGYGGTTTASGTLTVNNVAPTADFSFSDTTPTQEDTITMNDASTDVDADMSTLSWSWDFDNGNTSTNQNPTQSWIIQNTYTVNLTVTDGDGGTGYIEKDVTVDRNVSLGSGYELVSFSVNRTTTAANISSNFTSSTILYKWNTSTESWMTYDIDAEGTDDFSIRPWDIFWVYHSSSAQSFRWNTTANNVHEDRDVDVAKDTYEYIGWSDRNSTTASNLDTFGLTADDMIYQWDRTSGEWDVYQIGTGGDSIPIDPYKHFVVYPKTTGTLSIS